MASFTVMMGTLMVVVVMSALMVIMMASTLVVTTTAATTFSTQSVYHSLNLTVGCFTTLNNLSLKT